MWKTRQESYPQTCNGCDLVYLRYTASLSNELKVLRTGWIPVANGRIQEFGIEGMSLHMPPLLMCIVCWDTQMAVQWVRQWVIQYNLNQCINSPSRYRYIDRSKDSGAVYLPAATFTLPCLALLYRTVPYRTSSPTPPIYLILLALLHGIYLEELTG